MTPLTAAQYEAIVDVAVEYLLKPRVKPRKAADCRRLDHLPPGENRPCTACGTTGGYANPGEARPRRFHGLCLGCEHAARPRRKPRQDAV